jgi:membrane AbrB-like protein
MDMETGSNVLTIILLGVMGGGLGLFIRSTALVFIGPIILIGGYQIFFGGLSGVPSWIRVIIQMTAGFVLGANFAQISPVTLKNVLKPAIVVAAIMVVGGVAIGYTIFLLTGWDLKTCILATTFGGQTEMLLIAEGAGAGTEKVIILQFIRNQAALLVMFPLSRFFLKKEAGRKKGGFA